MRVKAKDLRPGDVLVGVGAGRGLGDLEVVAVLDGRAWGEGQDGEDPGPGQGLRVVCRAAGIPGGLVVTLRPGPEDRVAVRS